MPELLIDGVPQQTTLVQDLPAAGAEYNVAATTSSPEANKQDRVGEAAGFAICSICTNPDWCEGLNFCKLTLG